MVLPLATLDAFSPITPVVPFTSRDTATNLTILYALEKRLNELIVNINDVSATDTDNLNLAIEALTASLNTTLTSALNEINASTATLVAMEATLTTLQTTLITDEANYTAALADITALHASIVGDITALQTGKVSKTVVDKNAADFGLLMDGVSDETAHIQAAFDAANAATVAVIGGNVYEPGMNLKIPAGVYHLTTLAAPLVINFNLDARGVKFVVPNDYAGIVLKLGMGGGDVLEGATMRLPHVTKETNPTSFAGTGVRVANIYMSEIHFGRVSRFAVGHHYGGIGFGMAYNSIFPGWVDLCKIGWKIAPEYGGWANQNVWNGGGITQSPNSIEGAGVWRLGYRHILADGTAPASTGTVNANTFVGCDFEGDLSDVKFELIQCAYNAWLGGTRFEQGTVATNVTFLDDSATISTATAHGYSENDKLIFLVGGFAPGGLKNDSYGVASAPYYVVSVADPTHFTVSETRGGTPVVWMDGAGGGMVAYRCPRIIFDGIYCLDNVIARPYYAYPGELDVVSYNGAKANTVPPSRLPAAPVSPTSDTAGTKAAIDALIAIVHAHGLTL